MCNARAPIYNKNAKERPSRKYLKQKARVSSCQVVRLSGFCPSVLVLRSAPTRIKKKKKRNRNQSARSRKRITAITAPALAPAHYRNGKFTAGKYTLTARADLWYFCTMESQVTGERYGRENETENRAHIEDRATTRLPRFQADRTARSSREDEALTH